jgi:SAM-dependent methyltransferase
VNDAPDPPNDDLIDGLPIDDAGVIEPHAALDSMSWESDWAPAASSPRGGAPGSGASAPGSASTESIVAGATTEAIAGATATQRLTPALPPDVASRHVSAQHLVPGDLQAASPTVPLPRIPTNSGGWTVVKSGDGLLSGEPPSIPADSLGTSSRAAPAGLARLASDDYQAVDDTGLGDDVDDFMNEIMEEADRDADATTERTSTGEWFLEIFDDSWLALQAEHDDRCTAREASFIHEALDVPKGSRLLDVQCGHGRHAIELAANGYDMVGIDKSLSMLERGLQTAQRHSLKAKFVLGDVREISFEPKFDGAYFVGNSFGYFDDKTNIDVLRRISMSLRPGAKLVVEQLNRDWVLQQVPRKEWWESGDLVVMEDVDLDPMTSRLVIDRSILDGQGRSWEQKISIRLFAPHEWLALFDMVGLDLIELTGDWAHPGVHFGGFSRQCIAMGRRRE